MNCLQCQATLVEIPTPETPQIDVCPKGHGLWLDAGEIDFFVENYRALQAATDGATKTATSTQPAPCPRCGGLLDAKTVSGVALLICSSCKGWWLPQGSFTRLNEAYRGGSAPIRVNESSFYARAVARASAPNRTQPRPVVRSASTPRLEGLLFWLTFLGLSLVLVGFIVFQITRRTAATAHLTRAPDEFFFWLILGVVGGVGLFIYGFILNRKKRLIESIPTSTVRSLAVGLVEVAGSVQPDGPILRAPFSGAPSVVFSYKVEERHGSGKYERWETIAHGTSDQPIFVRDDTGTVLVVPLDAELIMKNTNTYQNDWLRSLPPETIAGLIRLGIDTGVWLAHKTLRCHESFIRTGEAVYVLGTARENPAADSGGGNAERLYIGSSPDEAFIISDRSEKELLFRLRWQVPALLFGGPALTVASLMAILTWYIKPGP